MNLSLNRALDFYFWAVMFVFYDLLLCQKKLRVSSCDSRMDVTR